MSARIGVQLPVGTEIRPLSPIEALTLHRVTGGRLLNAGIELGVARGFRAEPVDRRHPPLPSSHPAHRSDIPIAVNKRRITLVEDEDGIDRAIDWLEHGDALRRAIRSASLQKISFNEVPDVRFVSKLPPEAYRFDEDRSVIPLGPS